MDDVLVQAVPVCCIFLEPTKTNCLGIVMSFRSIKSAITHCSSVGISKSYRNRQQATNAKTQLSKNNKEMLYNILHMVEVTVSTGAG